MDQTITNQLNTIIKSSKYIKYSMLNPSQLKFFSSIPNKEYYALKYLLYLSPDDNNIFKLLITSTNINNIISYESKNTTLLIHACENNRYDLVEKLLSLGADVEVKSDGISPLGIACSFGYIDIIQLLLTNNANPNNLSNGVLPIVLFIQNNSDIHDGFMLLLYYGADINYPVNIIDNTILFSLLQHSDINSIDLIEYLFDNNFDIHVNNFPYIGKYIYDNRPTISSLDMLFNSISLNDKKNKDIMEENLIFYKLLILLNNCISPDGIYLEKYPLELSLSFGYFKISKLLLLAGAQIPPSISSKFYSDDDLNLLLGLTP